MSKKLSQIRNSITTETDSNESKRWLLDYASWLLIFGLFLIGICLFASPALIDRVILFLISQFDLRQWTLFAYFTVFLTVVFVVCWCRIRFNVKNDNLDEVDLFCARQFFIMSIFITVELWGGVVLRMSGFTRYAWFMIYQWLRYGTYSHHGILILLGGIIVVIINVVVIVRCVAAFLDRSVQ